MDRLFDRLGELLRRLPGGAAARGLRGDTAARAAAADPFLREAEEKLEEYLRTGRTGSGWRSPGPDPARHSPSPVPESLRRDFANLGLEPTASLEQVHRAHRHLFSSYHPDRFPREPEKQLLATRIAQILNSSFRRIRDYRRAAD